MRGILAKSRRAVVRLLGLHARFLRFVRRDSTRRVGQVYASDAMHEVAVMESAIAAVLRQAREHHATRVHRIVLRIGALSGVDPDALRFAFDVVTQGTAAEGAELAVDAVPARARCTACAEDFDVSGGFIFSCPRCSRLSGEIRQGRELELSRLEMS
jgi:hydrogenase nickel incorporation protein HypA/HybF